MNRWLSIDEETKRSAYRQVSNNVGISPFAVEKDWWLVQVLSLVFGMNAAPYMLFKGGTSLSKAWNLIQRFSEDVDLSLDRTFLGFPGKLSNAKRKELRHASVTYITGEFLEELRDKASSAGLNDLNINLVELQTTEADPISIEFNYHNLISQESYLQPRILLEIGCRSLTEPFSIREISSYLDSSFAGTDFISNPIHIPVVTPERTFLEKMFLLHEEFHRPHIRSKSMRMSRHIYDVIKLSDTGFAENALNDSSLYNNIVEHRYAFTRTGSVDYNLLAPGSLNPVPPQDVINEWKADYQTMLESMIYEVNPPDFNTLIFKLRELTNRINNISWTLRTEFPQPK